ncbi:uncharacterized protein LOC129231512 [Uloborus diversus]|uniref:uncharacterized protein LOC129231512 n=1 Tax=Uloborus diversus TaxID=327109 RepID=UPI002409D81B|nr:uncharacterized protein LOC129231512 [Uloborus diversus]XP_054721822.1 uncharacterized protein LOC129231512 [Uloborus diversus]XP_054721823.1 uncharacterized protein LOC129231512 [Uloborus diversus]XP_054721824.1 uncharacterized protein LOC129231512 [Uloborus diversus]
MIEPVANSNMAWQDMFPVVETSNLANKIFQSEEFSSASFGSLNFSTDPLGLALKQNTGIMEESEVSDMVDLNVSSLQPNTFSLDQGNLETLDFNFLWQSGLMFQNNSESQSEVLHPSPSVRNLEGYTDLLSVNEISTCGSSTADEPLMCTEPISSRIDSIQSISEDSNTSSISVNSSNPNENDRASKISPKLARQKYLEMRRKNNIASQRSRKIRKLKDGEMNVKLEELITENRNLTLLAEKLERQRDILQKHLLKAISKR